MSATVFAQIPDNLVVEGIPPIPVALKRDTSRYLEFRTAAFAAWLARGDKAEYIAMEHNSSAGPPTLPPLKGRHVVVVDYCFSRQLTESIAAEAASFIVLDHHASALKDLDGLDDALKVFEMGQSGATLAWDYFHPSTPAPPTAAALQLPGH